MSFPPLFVVHGVAFFQIGEYLCQNKGKEQVEHGGDDEGRRVEVALYDGARNAQDVVHGQDVDQGRILQEVDRFVSHRRQDARRMVWT